MFIRQLLRTIIILLPLFCFTWVIGLFAIAPGQAGQVFAILFIVANSLQVRIYVYNQFHSMQLSFQCISFLSACMIVILYSFYFCASKGFLIFVLHVLRHEKVWGKIKSWCKCDKVKLILYITTGYLCYVYS